MKKKLIYDAPETELVEVKVERGILIDSVGSVQAMDRVGGIWDEEE